MPAVGRDAVPAHPYRDRAFIRRLGAEARPYWPQLSAILLLDLLAAPLFLLLPVPLKVAVDSVVGSEPVPGPVTAALPDALLATDSRLLVSLAVLQVLVILLMAVQAAARHVLDTRTIQGLNLSFRGRLFRHVQRLSLAFHDLRGTADSIYRIQYDALALQQVTTAGLIPLVGAVVTLVAGIYVTARIDWQLALLSLTVMPALVLGTGTYRRRMRRRYVGAKELESNAMNVVQEVLTSVRVVKAFGQEDSEHERFVETSSEGMRAHVRLAFAEGTFGLFASSAIAIGTAGVLYIGIRNVESGALTLGEFLMVMTYLTQLYSPLRTATRKIAMLQSSLASAQRAFELLDEPPDVPDLPGARPLHQAVGEIEFRDVSFAYGSGEPVLRHLSLSVPAGTSVGIAGRTGAGKTTLVSLLPRFYDPTAGRILLDGVDLRDYRLADLRNQFSVVLQEPVLFSATIAENIRYGRADAGHDDVVAAAKAANAHDFIVSLPDRYGTLVGERGMRLSGGERQRIALARAFLKDAPILILDEPTSSVDASTEAAIIEAMERLIEGRTTFLIAHRLTTLDRCDARLELEGGRLRRQVALAANRGGAPGEGIST